MNRLHLFEFEDKKWFPDVLRKGTTDFLSFIFSKTNRYAPVVPLIKEVLEKEDTNHIIDLCSGAGGGIVNMQRDLEKSLGKKVKVTLTDKYPNKQAFDSLKSSYDEIDIINTSIDATNVPNDLKGFRTIFTAFHHFKPNMAEAILRDAVNKDVPIGVFELGNKGALAIIKLIISVPIGLILITPFLRPFKLSRIIFTYLIPLIPLCTIWDGIVSILRVYSPQELEEMTKKDWGKNYTWKTGILHHEEGVGKGEIIYLIGYPNKR
ncbi:hypothetical protein [Priestia megaterium]|uniref:hypothetical protein n=2 Tax=Priestia megaterium TaxID=1404 RepID=UPI000BFB8C13|nr:hypothetical protein [Priestia megaterium]PGR79778.1 hypothetical protein COC53_26660 [Priestia megaterium]